MRGSGTGPILLSQATFLLAHIANSGPVPLPCLQSIGLASLVTAVYAAGMAVIQRDCRRLFANLFLSHASLVLVGLELHTEISLTGSLCLWFSVILSLGGFGLTIRAMEALFGRV